MHLKHFSLLALLCCALPAFAQSPYQVVDLYPGSTGTFDQPETGIRATLGETAIFVGRIESGNWQVFASDGTPGNAVALLPAFNPSDVSVSGFVVTDSLCWFLRKDGVGTALYATDGTPDGTQLRFSQPNSTLSNLAVFQNDLLYKEVEPDFGGENLVRFNTTDNSVFTVGAFEWFGGLRDFAVANDTLIYAIAADAAGRNLYKANGNQFSAQKITQINTGSEFNQLIYLTTVGTKAFFFWKKDGGDYQLWVSNGTEAGTVGLKTFVEPFFGDLRADRAIAVFNNKLYFRAENPADNLGEELYVSDGTVNGTKVVKDIVAGDSDSKPKYFTVLGNKLWFSAINEWYNPRTWSTTGTSTLEAYTNFSYSGIQLASYKDSLLMVGYRADTGNEIFIGKGTASSTRELSDESTPGSDQFSAKQFTPTPNGFYFIGARTGGNGNELWRYLSGNPSSGVNEPAAAFEVQLGPNPGSDFLRVTAAEAERLQVFNGLGQLVYTGNFTGQQTFNTTAWPQGCYEVVLSRGPQTVTRRWVK